MLSHHAETNLPLTKALQSIGVGLGGPMAVWNCFVTLETFALCAVGAIIKTVALKNGWSMAQQIPKAGLFVGFYHQFCFAMPF